MSGIMQGIFGGKKEKSLQENTNRDLINQTYGGQANTGVDATNQIMALLSGDASGFQSFKDAVGFDLTAERGSRGVTNNAAARGLLRSGSTGQALVDYGNEVENQFASQYLERLLGVGNLGLGAGQLIAGVGDRKKESGSEKPGIGGFLGKLKTGIAASDRRLKTDITPVGRNPDGLTVYQYRYKGEPGVFLGVMAQEVAEVKPEALGPTVDGYMTVDYTKVNVLDRSE